MRFLSAFVLLNTVSHALRIDFVRHIEERIGLHLRLSSSDPSALPSGAKRYVLREVENTALQLSNVVYSESRDEIKQAVELLGLDLVAIDEESTPELPEWLVAEENPISAPAPSAPKWLVAVPRKGESGDGFVVFRGTVYPGDWLTDFSAGDGVELENKAEGKIRVHSGIYERLLEDKGIQKALQTAFKSTVRNWIFTGHSLGGGKAQVAALLVNGYKEEGGAFPQLNAKSEVVSFAAPPVRVVLDSEKTKTADKFLPMVNFVFGADVVPRLASSMRDNLMTFLKDMWEVSCLKDPELPQKVKTSKQHFLDLVDPKSAALETHKASPELRRMVAEGHARGSKVGLLDHLPDVQTVWLMKEGTSYVHIVGLLGRLTGLLGRCWEWAQEKLGFNGWKEWVQEKLGFFLSQEEEKFVAVELVSRSLRNKVLQIQDGNVEDHKLGNGYIKAAHYLMENQHLRISN